MDTMRRRLAGVLRRLAAKVAPPVVADVNILVGGRSLTLAAINRHLNHTHVDLRPYDDLWS